MELELDDELELELDRLFCFFFVDFLHLRVFESYTCLQGTALPLNFDPMAPRVKTQRPVAGLTRD